MSKFTDFFSMTRRERTGTLVVVAILAVAIAIAACVRSCHRPTPVTVESSEQMQRFKAQVEQITPESLQQRESRHERKNKKKHKRDNDNKGKSPKGSKAKSQKGNKKSPNHGRNRPLDEVPSF